MSTRTVDSLKYYLWHQDSSTVNIDTTPTPPPQKKNKTKTEIKQNKKNFETEQN